MSETYHKEHLLDRAAMLTMRGMIASHPPADLGPGGRAAFDELMGKTPAADNITYEAAAIGGVPGWWCRTPEAASGAAILYFHGGAYVLGSARAHRNFVGQIAARTRVDAFVPDYGRAPEHPFPVAIDDGEAVYRGLVAAGRSRIAIVGDSAAGGLAFVTLTQMSAAAQGGSVPRPVAGVAMSPWTDLTFSGESMTTRAAHDPLLTVRSLSRLLMQFQRSACPASRAGSPMHPQTTRRRLDYPAQIHLHHGPGFADTFDTLRAASHAHPEVLSSSAHCPASGQCAEPGNAVRQTGGTGMSNSIVEIVFTPHQPDPSGVHSADLSLFCKVLDTPPAMKWLGLLSSVLDAKLPVEKYMLRREKVTGRFSGIPGCEKTASDLTYLINQCVETINSYQANTIPLDASSRADQKLLNELHKYFEKLRGPQLEPAAFFATAPASIREALEEFNLYIHEYEGYLHSGNPGDKAAVDITFLNERMRPSMSPEDYRYFNVQREFGGLYLHYCEVGKPLLSAFEDEDEVISLHNIRPLEQISASFDVYFGESTTYRYDLEFRMRFHRWIRSLDLDPLDPKLCLGFMKIGQVILDNRFAGMSRIQFLEYFSHFLTLKRIVLH